MFVGSDDLKKQPDFVFEGEKHKYALSAYESFENAIYDQRFSGNMYSRENNLHDAAEDYINEIEKTTGKRLSNPYRGAWSSFLVEDVVFGLYDELVKNPFSSEDRKPGYFDRQQKKRQDKRLKEFYKELDSLKEEYPDLVIKNEADLQQDILAKAEAVRNRQALNQKEDGLAAFAGQMLGWLSDPGHLTTTAITGYFTGGTGTTLLGTVGRAALYEGTANAAQEVVSQFSVVPYKQELGFDYGLKDAAVNVAAAGVGGAALGAAVPAAKAGLKGLVSKTKALKNKGFKLKPLEEDALAVAEHQVTLKDMVDANSPYPAGSLDNMSYERRIEEMQNRLLRPYEEAALSEGWEKIAARNFERAHDVLARISREDMQDIVFEQGEWKGISGKSSAGYGMVKVVWKHGPNGYDTIPVMKDDILRFPEIVDSHLPMIDDAFGDTFHWSVKRKDGVQIMYIAKETPTSDGAQTMISIHAVDPKKYPDNRWIGVYSPERTTTSRLPARRSDVVNLKKDEMAEEYFSAAGGNMSPTSETYPKTRFQGGNDANNYNILPNNEKVKLDEIKYPTAKEIEEILGDKDFMLAGDEIDGALNMKSAKEILSEIKKEDAGIEEIVDCITSYGNAIK